MSSSEASSSFGAFTDDAPSKFFPPIGTCIKGFIGQTQIYFHSEVDQPPSRLGLQTLNQTSRILRQNHQNPRLLQISSSVLLPARWTTFNSFQSKLKRSEIVLTQLTFVPLPSNWKQAASFCWITTNQPTVFQAQAEMCTSSFACHFFLWTQHDLVLGIKSTQILWRLLFQQQLCYVDGFQISMYVMLTAQGNAEESPL